MSNALSIKDKWCLDEQLGSMLRDLEVARTATRTATFLNRLEALMADYDITTQDLLEWHAMELLGNEQ